jgi:hypothetical protein
MVIKNNHAVRAGRFAEPASVTCFFIDQDGAGFWRKPHRIHRAGIQAIRDRTLVTDRLNKPALKGLTMNVQSGNLRKYTPGLNQGANGFTRKATRAGKAVGHHAFAWSGVGFGKRPWGHHFHNSSPLNY